MSNSEEQSEELEFSLDLLLIGYNGVGKSSLLSRFSDNIYNEEYLPSVRFFSKKKFPNQRFKLLSFNLKPNL